MRVDWEEMKAVYLRAPEVSLKQFASAQGLAYQTLKTHAAKGGWYREKQLCLRQQARAAAPAVASGEDAFVQRRRINEIADRLLESIRLSSEETDKPTGIYNLTTALKNVTAVLRDVNDIPNIKEERSYEITKRKLELAQSKLPAPPAQNEAGGVVLLPEVKAADAAE